MLPLFGVRRFGQLSAMVEPLPSGLINPMGLGGGLGPELVVDPGFDDATKWVVGTGGEVTGSEARITNGSTNLHGSVYANTVATVVPGATYKIVADITSFLAMKVIVSERTAADYYLSYVVEAEITAAGAFSRTITIAGATTGLLRIGFRGTAATNSLVATGVSIRRIV